MIFTGINLTRGYPIDIKPPPLRSVISRKRTKRRCRAGSNTGFDAVGGVGGQQPGFVRWCCWYHTGHGCVWKWGVHPNKLITFIYFNGEYDYIATTGFWGTLFRTNPHGGSDEQTNMAKSMKLWPNLPSSKRGSSQMPCTQKKLSQIPPLSVPAGRHSEYWSQYGYIISIVTQRSTND